MPDIDLTLPSTVWKNLDEERRMAAATAFWGDEQSISEQAEVVSQIARRINFRPKSVLGLSLEKKARHLTRMAKISEPVAARLLVAYHLAHQRPMMGAFLDSLGIGHENGLIVEDQVKPPDRNAVVDAGRKLSAQYPASDVRLYFETLLIQDSESWAALRDVLDASA
jgi:hypothetical protein